MQLCKIPSLPVLDSDPNREMLSVLRRVSSSSFSLSVPLHKPLMDSSSSASKKKIRGTSHRLLSLARQLRLYKAPPPPGEDIDAEESSGKVVSLLGFQESVTPVSNQPERFKPKRAAVLICLFEGDSGEFRVILTKRASNLSSHSGQLILVG